MVVVIVLLASVVCSSDTDGDDGVIPTESVGTGGVVLAWVLSGTVGMTVSDEVATDVTSGTVITGVVVLVVAVPSGIVVSGTLLEATLPLEVAVLVAMSVRNTIVEVPAVELACVVAIDERAPIPIGVCASVLVALSSFG